MDYDKDLLQLLDDTLAPEGVLDGKTFEHFYNKFAEDLMYIGEPSQDDEDDWAAWEESTLKHKLFTYGPERPAGVGNYPKDKSDLPYLLAYHAYENPEFTDEVADEIVSYMGGDVSESSADFEILYTATLSSELEYHEVQKIFELGQKNPTAHISTVVYSEETIMVVYKGKVTSEELLKEVEEYFES